MDHLLFILFLIYFQASIHYYSSLFRDRPFNLKEGGGYSFLFRSEICFRTTQELEYFFLSRKARNFFQEFNIRLYDKNSESDYFFSLHQNIFFSYIGNQNIFLEKTHNSPFQVKWSFPNTLSSFSTCHGEIYSIYNANV
jgi:hypothetical protein